MHDLLPSSKIGVIASASAALWALIGVAILVAHGPLHLRSQLRHELGNVHLSRLVGNHPRLSIAQQICQA
jgi:hypothetical protein